MRFPESPLFDEERLRFDLQFTCEQCAHFAPAGASLPAGWPDRGAGTAGPGCAHGYPVDDHLEGGAPGPGQGRELVFCKEFELR